MRTKEKTGVSNEVSNRVSNGVSNTVSNWEGTTTAVLQFIKENPNITRKIMAEKISIAIKNVQEHINKLKAESPETGSATPSKSEEKFVLLSPSIQPPRPCAGPRPPPRQKIKKRTHSSVMIFSIFSLICCL